LATRLANDIIDCDPSIPSLLILDNFGKILSVKRSSRLDKAAHASPELVEKFGTIVMLILGATRNAVELMGGLEFIIGAFKNQKVLLINLQEYDLSLALRLSRSANAGYVYNKIAEMLAIS